MAHTLLMVGDSVSDQNLYYRTGFLASDPFLYIQNGHHSLLVTSAMEQGRAQKESKVANVRSFEDYGYRELLAELGDRLAAFAGMIGRVVQEERLDSIVVQPLFPVAYADHLRADGIEIDVDDKALDPARRTKSEDEIEAIAAAQRAAERAVRHIIGMIATSEARSGILYLDGDVLTSERLQAELEILLLRDGMDTSLGPIVACGPRAADPHWEGAGPLREGQAIVIDVFPRGRKSRYFADMTRTVVKGEPRPELEAMYDAVRQGLNAALSQIRAGVNGKDVHQAVLDIFESLGYAGEGGGPRYIHGTGHGVGLDIHEAPNLSVVDEELKVGDVVTVEPGLYDPEIGAVRLEDLVVVTADGYRNLTDFPKQFRL